MIWAVIHLSECHKCWLLASELSAQEIKGVLIGTPYGKPDFIQQTIDHYFETRQENE